MDIIKVYVLLRFHLKDYEFEYEGTYVDFWGKNVAAIRLRGHAGVLLDLLISMNLINLNNLFQKIGIRRGLRLCGLTGLKIF